MAKKKRPSFEIPEVVRRAGQSGWVYRTERPKAAPGAARGERRAPLRHPKPAAIAGTPAPSAVDAERIVAPGLTTPPPASEPSPPMTGGLVGFGLHVVAVPFVVPLYLTAAISRRLGFLGR